jgi:endonuclease G
VDLATQQDRAARRYRATADQRKEIRRRQQAAGSPVVDTAEQVRARARRLLGGGAVPVEALATALAAAPPAPDGGRVLERIIAVSSELQGVNFLGHGARAARTVARMSMTERGRVVPVGTGFLVGERLLLTNNHVLPDATSAAAALAEFDCELDLDGAARPVVAFTVDPEVLFVTDENLDFTLVALAPDPAGRRAGQTFGWNRLVARQGKVVIGEPVNVVGHPDGRPKEIAIRENRLLNQLDEFLHYEADTRPGNSGSPVFNDEWEVVALHHSGVASTDAAGHRLTTTGARWRPEDGDDAVAWVANEGARVSVLLHRLAAAALPAAQRAVLAELGPHALPSAGEVLVPAAAPVAAAAPVEAPVPGAPEQARRGLTPRRAREPHLVFLHGRGQQGRDPVALRSRWAGGLARGLAGAGLAPVDVADVWFPFYGDAHAGAIGGGARDGRERITVHPLAPTVVEALAPEDAGPRTLYATLLQEAAERAGMPPEQPREGLFGGLAGGLVSGLQPQLSWLAARSGLDDVVIGTAFADVAAYLDRAGVRDTVLASVLDAFPDSGEVVLVSHSLGTVVAMDLLTRLPPGATVPLLVTAGSPLGMDAVHKRLLTGGPQLPPVVGGWLNAWCPADAVAIGCPLGRAWGAQVRDVCAANAKDRAHDIEEYLSDAEVARAVGLLVRR